jgi:hypothetical protein
LTIKGELLLEVFDGVYEEYNKGILGKIRCFLSDAKHRTLLCKETIRVYEEANISDLKKLIKIAKVKGYMKAIDELDVI